MKGLAASNIAWRPDEDAGATRILVESGFSAIEVAPSKLFDDPASASAAAVRAQRQLWQDRGLPIVAMQSLLFGHPELRLFADPDTRAAMVSHLTRISRLAGGLGAGAMVFGSPGNRQRGELPLPAATAIAEDLFGELGEIAAQHGTTMCLEANAAAYGCDFVCQTVEAVELVQAVDTPGFRVQIDTSTMSLNGEHYDDAIRTAAPHAGHFHISEPHLAAVSATGTVPIAAVLEAASSSGYDGWISVEMRAVGGDGNLDALATAAMAVAAARNTVTDV